jgi:hypothetical protein
MMSQLSKSAVSLSLAAACLAIAFQSAANSAQEIELKSDVTIYLEPPILGGGGTIIVLPTEVPVDEWRQDKGLPNPALKDNRLADRKPVTPQDRRLSVVVSDPVSVVKFNYPAGGTFIFRPLPAIDSNYPVHEQASVLMTVGSAGDLHPVTGEEVDLPRVQVLHILGRQVSEDRSRQIGEDVRLGFLSERYDCKQFENATSCSASKDKLNE